MVEQQRQQKGSGTTRADGTPVVSTDGPAGDNLAPVVTPLGVTPTSGGPEGSKAETATTVVPPERTPEKQPGGERKVQLLSTPTPVPDAGSTTILQQIQQKGTGPQSKVEGAPLAVGDGQTPESTAVVTPPLGVTQGGPEGTNKAEAVTPTVLPPERLGE